MCCLIENSSRTPSQKYALLGVSTVTALALLTLGILFYHGYFGGATTGPFIGGTLALVSIVFLIPLLCNLCKSTSTD